MTAWREVTVMELKLFLRQPLTVVFTLGMPIILVFVLGSVFGNTAQEGVYRGQGAMTFYTPAYLALVLASVGFISLPVHLATYRETGVLRRFRASSMRVSTLVGAHLAVTFVLGVAGGVLVMVATFASYDVEVPVDPWGVLAAFLLATVTFASLGVFLGAVMPSSRTAQGAGVLLWFVMLMIGGAGPPPEVLSDTMRGISNLMPLRRAVTALQDPWFGLGWNAQELLLLGAFIVVATLLSIRWFRWD